MASFKLVALIALLVACIALANGRSLESEDDYHRIRRAEPEDKYVASASTDYGKGYKGHVGPVYTFVKTDPKANFKWGVRHRVGVQYGR